MDVWMDRWMDERMNDGHEGKRAEGIVKKLGSRLETRLREACVLGVALLSQMIKMSPARSPSSVSFSLCASLVPGSRAPEAPRRETGA